MKRLLGILVWLALGWSAPARAALVELDLVTPGDKAITQDTVTGLQWLDIKLTGAQPYNSILAGFGGYTTTYGFRLATVDEFKALVANQGLSLGQNVQGQTAPALDLIQRLGYLTDIYDTPGQYIGVTGWLNSPGSDLLNGTIGAIENTGATYISTGAYSSSDRNNSVGYIGGFLVRSTGDPQGVPGPLPLMGALAAFAYLRRVRRAVRAQQQA